MTDEVPVRDAATVVLLRDGVEGLETWLLTRVAEMTFAAGMSVFPGGRVEASDADLPFVAAPTRLAAELGCEPRLARALLGAAVRETYEETGVLLTAPAADLRGERAAVEAGRLDFGALLREHGLAIDPEALRPWARWVTPVGEVRRYDTRFFVGALPAGAEPADVTSESSTAGWELVTHALEQGRQRQRRLMPPTIATLTSLLPFAGVAAVLAAEGERDLSPARPQLHRGVDGSLSVTLPDGSTVPLPGRPASPADPVSPADPASR